MSYLSQDGGVVIHNFGSAATGIAWPRRSCGECRHSAKTIGISGGFVRTTTTCCCQLPGLRRFGFTGMIQTSSPTRKLNDRTITIQVAKTDDKGQPDDECAVMVSAEAGRKRPADDDQWRGHDD